MALSIPIISEFDGTGLDKFKRELDQAETNSKKAGIVMKKAFVPASIAIAGLATGLFDAVKGAIEDEAASDKLANTLKRVSGATEDSIKKAEDWITQQGKTLGFSDDELRPALGRLATATGDVTKAQDILRDAMDIATQKGVPLETVVKSLEKAYGGNMTALQKLFPEYRDMIKEGATFEEVMAEVAKTTGGAASDAANTAQGRFERLGIALGETKESIGAALLPAVEAVLPFLQTFAKWAQDNPEYFMIAAGALAAIAASIVAINIAMALNPIGLIAIGVILLIAGLIVAYKRFEGFRKLVDTIFDGIKLGFGFVVDYLKFVAGIYKEIFNGIAKAWNNTIGKLSFKVPGWVPGIGGKGFDVPNIPMLADGGIVTGPTLALIGEAGPEAVVPLDRMGSMGGGDVNIYVQGADPNAVVDALRTYMFRNGSVPIRVS
jgi:prepilin signal peptidase PulO-like enzyme (type II secretory pathway)